MNANTVIGWEPSAAEARYLFESVMRHSNLFATNGDMLICIRIMGKFRTHFAATHREPPMEVCTLCTQRSCYKTISLMLTKLTLVCVGHTKGIQILVLHCQQWESK